MHDWMCRVYFLYIYLETSQFLILKQASLSMNILIDGRPLVRANAGISTFLKGSITAWATQCPHDNFIVVLPRKLDETYSVTGLPHNIKFVIYTNRFLQKFPNLLWLILMMPILSRRFKADIYYSPLPCLPFLLPKKIKTIIVVHDVVNIEYRKTMQLTNIISNLFFFKRSVKRADIIWTNSYYTKSKVEHYFPKRKCQDIITGCSIDRSLYKRLSMSEEEKEDLKKKYGITKPFILFVGSLEPRKNLSFLLSLMPEIYARHQIQLVVVGAKGWKNTSIRQTIEAKGFPHESTIFCNYVSNQDLAKLYNTATCFVSASQNEGFGMPQLEALCCGCPVITAHNSAMIEVAYGKTGASTVKGYITQDWIDAIETVLQNRPTPDNTQLKEYDWRLIINRILKEISR